MATSEKNVIRTVEQVKLSSCENAVLLLIFGNPKLTQINEWVKYALLVINRIGVHFSNNLPNHNYTETYAGEIDVTLDVEKIMFKKSIRVWFE